MPDALTPTELQSLLDDSQTLALLDVREHGEYNTAHIPGASAVPRRQLEFRLPRLVPFTGTLLVLYDDDGARASLAADTARSMGYSQVRLLQGGINRWASEGRASEWGMNVPSKDFGEKMQVVHDIPELHPLELQELIERGENLVILDSRTPEEHRFATIPGSRSAPGGELALRINELAPDPDTTVVVHCAGRTRSITGARVLQRMGGRKVFDLKNGTMGWRMAGLTLEHGSDRVALPAPTAEGLSKAEAFAARLASEDGVQRLDVADLPALCERRSSENVYLIDVRTQGEYAAGHIPGFQWSPGGQAVQRSDDLVAVKNGHVVFACDGHVRAIQSASWYRLMGFANVYAVDGGTEAWKASGQSLVSSAGPSESGGYDEGLADARPAGYAEALEQVEVLTAGQVYERLESASPPLVLFVDTSRDFSAGHIPGARWVSRSWLELQVESIVPGRDEPVLVTCADGLNSVLAAATLTRMGYDNVAVLDQGMRAWRESALAVERGLSGVMKPPDDVLYMGTDRNWSAAIHYLQWETELGEKYVPQQD